MLFKAKYDLSPESWETIKYIMINEKEAIEKLRDWRALLRRTLVKSF